MSPAWSTICLISDMSNNRSTFGPLFIWIESLIRKVNYVLWRFRWRILRISWR
jgi:hypothetical protein